MTVLPLSTQNQIPLAQKEEPQSGYLSGRSLQQIPSNHRLAGVGPGMFDGLIEGIATMFAVMVGAIVFFASAYATGSAASAAVITGATALLFFACVGCQSFGR